MRKVLFINVIMKSITRMEHQRLLMDNAGMDDVVPSAGEQ